MLVGQQRTDVIACQQLVEQIDEGNHPQHTGDPANAVNHPVAEDGQYDDKTGKGDNADPVLNLQQLGNRLPGQQRAAGRKPDVHQAHQHQRHHRAIHPELHTAGNHLRQTQLRPLGTVQRHHRAAQHLPDKQADQRPEHIAAQHYGQRARHDCRDLQVGAQPQRELAKEPTMTFGFGDVVDRTFFDQRRCACTIIINSHVPHLK